MWLRQHYTSYNVVPCQKLLLMMEKKREYEDVMYHVIANIVCREMLLPKASSCILKIYMVTEIYVSMDV